MSVFKLLNPTKPPLASQIYIRFGVDLLSRSEDQMMTSHSSLVAYV